MEREECFSPAISTLSFAVCVKVSIVSSHVTPLTMLLLPTMKVRKSKLMVADNDTIGRRMWPPVRDMPKTPALCTLRQSRMLNRAQAHKHQQKCQP